MNAQIMADTEVPGFGDWRQDQEGEFSLGGRPLSQVVASVGGTPCYLYDRARTTERARSLREALHPSVRIHYAIKANPMPALVSHMARLVDGLDVASGGELRVALDSGMDPQEISFAGPGKSERELQQAYAAEVLVNVESFREVTLLSDLCKRSGRPARVAVRVNLPFELRSSGMKMTGGPKQFGIDADQVPRMLDEIAAGGLQFEGFHLFAGSQNLRADAIIDAQTRSYGCALDWATAAPGPVRSLNLGGGFGIPYSLTDRRLEVDRVIENLNRLSLRMADEFSQAHIVIELGRYLVGESGIYVCRVVERKLSQGHVYLVTDGGMHHHLAATGNFGQVVRRNYPVAINRRSEDMEVVSIVGPLCTPLDLLGERVKLNRAEEGDLVLVFQSGAYGRTASPRSFLGHPDVAEALI